MLVLDGQRDYAQQEITDPRNFKLRNGKKINGLGSKEVAIALEGFWMKDVMVTEGEDLRLNRQPKMNNQAYYLLKVKKSLAYCEEMQDNCERQASM